MAISTLDSIHITTHLKIIRAGNVWLCVVPELYLKPIINSFPDILSCRQKMFFHLSYRVRVHSNRLEKLI